MVANLFDVDYYRQANPDLAVAGLTTNEQLSNHFFTSGVFEGRTFSRFADLNVYRSSNSDLGGFDNLTLYNHLANFGVQEGRTFSTFYSPQFYQGANFDLSSLGKEALYNHLQASGLNEGRRFSAFFDIQFYRGANGDLGGLSSPQLFDHFRSFGLAEGRDFSSFIDLSYYQSKNTDLAGLNNPQLFDHFQSFGLAEGRKFSPFVDVDFYLSYISNYQDLTATRATVNNNRVLAFQELQSSGLRQGQRFSPIVDLDFYRDYNSDLASLDNVSLFNQLVVTGSQQGRRLSVSYDPIFYLNANPDLAGLNSAQLLEHFETFGLNEGRQSSDSFSASFYLGNNADLAAAGFNNQQSLNHYESIGLREGRQANNVAISAAMAGTFLGNAANLGTFTTGRSGAVSERIDNNSTSDVYRFTVATSLNVSLQITNLSAQVNYFLATDRNANGQVDAGEIITSISTSTSGNIGGNLAEGTYYIIVQQAVTNAQTNYRLNTAVNLLPISNADLKINTSRDPGESAATALDLGNLDLSDNLVEFSEFIGTADPSDIYRLTATDQGSNIGQVFNIASSVMAEVIIDSNGNGLLESGETIFTRTGDENIRLFVTNLPEGPITFYIRITPNPATERGTYSLG